MRHVTAFSPPYDLSPFPPPQVAYMTLFAMGLKLPSRSRTNAASMLVLEETHAGSFLAISAAGLTNRGVFRMKQILGLHFLWVFALSALVIMGNHLDFGEGGGESWLIITEDMVTRFDAFGQARSMLPKALDDVVSLERADVRNDATTYFIYTSPNDNMLTPSGLRVIKQVCGPLQLCKVDVSSSIPTWR